MVCKRRDCQELCAVQIEVVLAILLEFQESFLQNGDVSLAVEETILFGVKIVSVLQQIQFAQIVLELFKLVSCPLWFLITTTLGEFSNMHRVFVVVTIWKISFGPIKSKWNIDGNDANRDGINANESRNVN